MHGSKQQNWTQLQANPGVASRFMGVAWDVGMNVAAAAAGAYLPGVSKSKAKKALKEVRGAFGYVVVGRRDPCMPEKHILYTLCLPSFALQAQLEYLHGGRR